MNMAPSSISSVSTSSRVSKGGGANVTTAIAIDKDKNSESAVRWAIDNLVKKVATVILVHVKTTQSLQSSRCPRSCVVRVVVFL